MSDLRRPPSSLRAQRRYHFLQHFFQRRQDERMGQPVAKASRVDWSRILVLRTASDFDQPPPGMTAAENLARNAGRQYVGYLPALESAWRVGKTVVQEITTHWNKYK
jgi:purine nucleoside permease